MDFNLSTIGIFGIVLVVFLLFIFINKAPKSLSDRVIASVSTSAALLTAISLFVSWTLFRKSVAAQSRDLNTRSYVDTEKLFFADPDLTKFYNSIYDKEENLKNAGITYKEHVMVTILSQNIEDVDSLYNFSSYTKEELFKVDSGYIALFKAYVNAPIFKQVWPTIKTIFDKRTGVLVDLLWE